MDISRIRALRGPNLWTRHTAIEAMVLCQNQECDLTTVPDFEQRLRHLFPGLGQLRTTQQGAVLSMAHAIEDATLHMQIAAGCPVTFSRTTLTPEAGMYQVVVEYTEEDVGRLALELAQEQFCSSAQDIPSSSLEFSLSWVLRSCSSLKKILSQLRMKISRHLWLILEKAYELSGRSSGSLHSSPQHRFS